MEETYYEPDINYLKVGVNFDEGEEFEISAPGHWDTITTSKGEKVKKFKIVVKNSLDKEYEVAVPKKSGDKFIQLWGKDTKEWVGKKILAFSEDSSFGKYVMLQPKGK